MSAGLGLMIEGLVAALLAVTIAYCVLLNRRLARLKADEQTLKATISELITATEIAERAIAGLKLTVQECDHTLGRRLKTAESLSAELAQHVASGEQVVVKLAQIAGVSRPLESVGVRPPVASDAIATVAAAEAFTMRARMRAQTAAA